LKISQKEGFVSDEAIFYSARQNTMEFRGALSGGSRRFTIAAKQLSRNQTIGKFFKKVPIWCDL
jgi:hypothetical protein